ncbi:MAG: flagellar basal body-associated protein FliL [Methylocystaceae bacterium]
MPADKPVEKPEGEKKKKFKAPEISKDVKFIMVGVVLFMVALGCSFIMMKSLLAPLMPQSAAVKQKTETGTLITVGEFTTNISDPSGTRYVKTEVVVEVEKDKTVEEEVNGYMPVIKDNILNILAASSIAELDVSNREVLKQQIKNSLNEALGSEKVLNVYFTTFLIQ